MMKKIAVFTLLILSALVGYAQTTPQRQAAASQQPQPNAAATPAAQRALIDQYCVTCHSEALKRGGLVLANLDMTHVSDNAETWERVIRKLRAGVMPPPGARRPDPA